MREGESAYELVAQVGDTAMLVAISAGGRGRAGPPRLDDRRLRDLPAATPLRIELRHPWRRKVLQAWEDDEDGKVERSVGAIVAEVVVACEARFRRSLVEAVEAERERRERVEEARRLELERLRVSRLDDLRTSGELLAEAGRIRDLVRRVESAMRDRSDIDPSRLHRWRAWALSQADAVDPILSGQVMSHLHVPDLDDDLAAGH